MAIYGVKVVNDRLDGIVAVTPQAIEALTEWQKALPPAMTDALDDRRMPEYRENIHVSAELMRDWKTERMVPVIEVSNNGDQVVSLMSIRLQVEDDESLPLEELTVYAATPLAIENDWRGPLLPGSKRRFRAERLRSDSFGEMAISWEISELRVWAASEPSEPPEVIETLEAAETLSLTSDDVDSDPEVLIDLGEE